MLDIFSFLLGAGLGIFCYRQYKKDHPSLSAAVYRPVYPSHFFSSYDNVTNMQSARVSIEVKEYEDGKRVTVESFEPVNGSRTFIFLVTPTDDPKGGFLEELIHIAN